ncbi:pyridoxamine 5'-phosphate oxidase [Nocardioides oleivorans]|uniref:Pyridoxine/pyridoxamine 5'-phosphate oxidase n=1 Tax=Nocardioides oleivorans TaxID=273676 RepID=A0A4Q2RZD2_9ACTN|nr:pyridoxamine 5'-phosphate oxidase [Nocardioides oleivorans]RYB94670.1 pyridoxamine 5'-phosphate oxidase [Nocardioides oleivorans]
MDLSALREEYGRGGLDVPDLAADPIGMFERWLQQSIDAGVHEPNAMVLATSAPDGRPSSRMVLLKGVGPDGFVFFTNQASRKGDELAANPHCALLFPWHPLERQVRVEGTASVLGDAEVETYFHSRPRGAQLGAWASAQSRPVASRADLASSYAQVEERFGVEPTDAEVPVPPHWGGYRVTPEVVEFWQGRPSRMHDRLVYRRDGSRWVTERLAP